MKKLRLFIIFIIFLDKKVVLLELGVGEMTPSIIKLPFWEMTYKRKSIPTAEMSNLKKKVMILWLFRVVSRILLILVLKNV